MLSLKNFLPLVLFLSIPLVHAAGVAEGPRTGGGGDLCEDRFKEVRDDLKSWINSGGPNGLRLPKGMAASQYSQAMLGQIATAKVACVAQGDSGFPVQVNGTPKVCVFVKTDTVSQVTCDISKFQAMAPPDQYVLVHHELAGLADIELPNGDSSNYEISNQISEYLEIQPVLKLAVKPAVGATGASGVVANQKCPQMTGTYVRTDGKETLVILQKECSRISIGAPGFTEWQLVDGKTHVNHDDEVAYYSAKSYFVGSGFVTEEIGSYGKPPKLAGDIYRIVYSLDLSGDLILSTETISADGKTKDLEATFTYVRQRGHD